MIRSETSGRVARIRFDRPEKKNAITAEMYAQLADALTAAREDSNVRAILLQGSAECFTAGNDLGDFLERPPHGEGSPTWRVFEILPALDKPLVAAVGGPAVGIVTAVVSQDRLLDEAAKAAAALAALPPQSVRITKRLMKSWHAQVVKAAIAEEGRVFLERLASPEAKEAMRAFLEKRKPDFS